MSGCSASATVDAEMLAIARAIIAQRIAKFDPSKFRDRYQQALQELIEAKMKGVARPAARAARPAHS